jgi:hypothetical protein
VSEGVLFHDVANFGRPEGYSSESDYERTGGQAGAGN